MVIKIKPVHIRVHPLFFDNIFEPSRKKLEKRLNKKKELTQIEFTGILAQNKIKIKLNKFSNKFAPKELKKKRFIL